MMVPWPPGRGRGPGSRSGGPSPRRTRRGSCASTTSWNPGRAWVKVGGRGFCCMSRFDVFPGLQAEEAESSQAGTVPAEVAAGCGVVGQAGAGQDADDGAGDGGEQPGGVAGPEPGGVFGVCGVAPQVKAVLDAPVAAVAGEQELRAGL